MLQSLRPGRPCRWFGYLFASCSIVISGVWSVHAADRPNIVLIYADDLGYGDVGCYGATKLQTPNLDRLAREGVRFTDAHAAAATCTPSRFAMLTGQYAWRRKGTGVLPGDARLIIPTETTTLASILHKAGYATSVIGKWHLGLGNGEVDWNTEIKPGPLELGFDSSYIIPATGDRVPCVYVKDHKVDGLDPNDPIRVSYGKPIGDGPSGVANPELLKVHPSHGHNQTIVNGISRIGYMTGGNSARWVDEDMADVLTRKATQTIRESADKPFFLYYALHDVHVPRVPHARFVGLTGMGPRGDVIAELDWSVGEILKSLDELGIAKETLVIFTSDNGPVVDDGYQDGAIEKLNGHRPSGPLRGGKYSAFEAGTRVPFLVRWPARVKPGVSNALVCQIDLLASFAALTGQSLKDGDAPDSQDVLASLLNESPKGREFLIEQAGVLSVRSGPWKYIEPGKGPRKNASTNTETGNDSVPQLYNLDEDLSETTNLAERFPERVRDLQSLLDGVRKKTGSARNGK
ncbi:sulfatase family protein [Singulisphaera sp. PoT]|uniref:sulfatase family protein n=1 Tax=Singulisphaera sp. PoT TaxID=3411797 RepID=UPI003BF4C16F